MQRKKGHDAMLGQEYCNNNGGYSLYLYTVSRKDGQQLYSCAGQFCYLYMILCGWLATKYSKNQMGSVCSTVADADRGCTRSKYLYLIFQENYLCDVNPLTPKSVK